MNSKLSKGGSRFFGRYNTPFFIVLISLLSSFFITIYRYWDHVFATVLKWYFYPVWGMNFVLSILILSLVVWVDARLNEIYSWKEVPIQRLMLQILAGFIVPMALIFLAAVLFFAYLGFDLLDSDFLRGDYPLIGVLLAGLNFYCFHNWRVDALEFKVMEQKEGDAVAEELKWFYRIDTHSVTRKIGIDEIRYFYLEEAIVYLQLREGEPLVTEETSLVDLERRVLGLRRINRTILVNNEEIESCFKCKEGKLHLTLHSMAGEISLSLKVSRELEDWVLDVVDIRKRRA